MIVSVSTEAAEELIQAARHLRRFPYSVIYYIRAEELRVVALAHHRRKPGYWSGRN